MIRLNLTPPGPVPSRDKGYTTVELVIAMFILGTVIFTAQQVYKIAQRSYAQVDEKSQIERVITYTMDQMVQQIRQTAKVKTLGMGTTVLTNQTVHLDAGGNTVCAIALPNLSNGVSQCYNAYLVYFLRTMPDGTVKLFQRMQYYTGSYTEAFPAMASTDEYRLGKPAATPATEPNVGSPTPTPTVVAANTPTPSYNIGLGRMPGIYNNSRLNFDDVSFYYDNADGILSIGMVVSVKSQSLSLIPSGINRRRLYLTTSVAMRNLAQ